ncbi:MULTISPECIES: LytR/AlgR family response regulator transcription factor [Enterococcus]|uniref:LytR/AlgR family response regulator transcription factor n=1 Tax=Enterococcus TaxID=1350 RepID=UPI0005B3A9E1|nr:LytTR family transcriptional regulator DNA-binding domain-containing protein [Enterococcus faecium]
MTNIYLIEDNLAHLTYIKKTVEKHKQKNGISYHIHEVIDIVNFNKKIVRTTILDSDVFFIDIKLSQYFNGVDLAEKIRLNNSKCLIIFITSEENRTLEVINKNISPFGYIIKSASNIDSIDTQLVKILDKIRLIQTEKNDILRFKSLNDDLLISLSEINYLTTIKGNRFHTYLQTVEGEHIINHSFANVKKMPFPDYFIVSLKSYIINTHQLKSLNRKSGEITFKNDYKLYLSPLLVSKLTKLVDFSIFI